MDDVIRYVIGASDIIRGWGMRKEHRSIQYPKFRLINNLTGSICAIDSDYNNSYEENVKVLELKVKTCKKINMRYVDKLQEVKPFESFNWFDMRKRVKACSQLIDNEEKSAELAFDTFIDCKNQIQKWKEMMSNDGSLDFSVEIENFELLQQYYDLNGRYLLLNMDFLVAFKYLLKAKSDWEYRFFARRTYTLMHETKMGFVGKIGAYNKVIKGKVSESTFDAYMQCLKNFNKFFEEYDAEFTNIRNNTEAHKGENFETQYTSISELSVDKSALLIQCFHTYLAQLYMVLNVVLYGISSYTNKRLNECIKQKISHTNVHKKQ